MGYVGDDDSEPEGVVLESQSQSQSQSQFQWRSQWWTLSLTGRRMFVRGVSLGMVLVCSIGCKKETERPVGVRNASPGLKKVKSGLVGKENHDAEKKLSAFRLESLKSEFRTFNLHALTDTVKADLNGDRISDFAFFEKTGDKRALFFMDGKSRSKTKIGQEPSFGEMADDFSWVDYWGVTNDRQTYEIQVKDAEIVGDTVATLVYPSLFVRKDEVGGGVITFKDNRFIWIHQSD